MRFSIIEAPDQNGGFVCPSAVGLWNLYFGHLLTASGNRHLDDYRRFLRNALTHRCQYLESTAALIIHHAECHQARNPGSMHETVLRYNIHAFVTVIASCLEGIGAYWLRCRRFGTGTLLSPQIKLNGPKWKADIVQKVSAFHHMNVTQTASFKDDLDWLWEQRHAVHLDSIQPRQAIDFHDFDMDCFKRAYNVFRQVLLLEAAYLPQDTSLNEVI